MQPAGLSLEKYRFSNCHAGEVTVPKNVCFRVKNVSKIVGTENEKQQGRVFAFFSQLFQRLAKST